MGVRVVLRIFFIPSSIFKFGLCSTRPWSIIKFSWFSRSVYRRKWKWPTKFGGCKTSPRNRHRLHNQLRHSRKKKCQHISTFYGIFTLRVSHSSTYSSFPESYFHLSFHIDSDSQTKSKSSITMDCSPFPLRMNSNRPSNNDITFTLNMRQGAVNIPRGNTTTGTMFSVCLSLPELSLATNAL